MDSQMEMEQRRWSMHVLPLWDEKPEIWQILEHLGLPYPLLAFTSLA